MIIRLIQPPTKNWLLIAEQLDDPITWDRFVPCHTASSQRWQFDCKVKEVACGQLKLKPCKDLLARGVSVFEYNWETQEDDILGHALAVAEGLGVDVLMGEGAVAAGSDYTAA